MWPALSEPRPGMQSDEAAVAPRPACLHPQGRWAGSCTDLWAACGLRKCVDTAVPVQGSMVTRAREGASGDPLPSKGGRPRGLALGRGGSCSGAGGCPQVSGRSAGSVVLVRLPESFCQPRYCVSLTVIEIKTRTLKQPGCSFEIN